MSATVSATVRVGTPGSATSITEGDHSAVPGVSTLRAERNCEAASLAGCRNAPSALVTRHRSAISITPEGEAHDDGQGGGEDKR